MKEIRRNIVNRLVEIGFAVIREANQNRPDSEWKPTRRHTRIFASLYENNWRAVWKRMGLPKPTRREAVEASRELLRIVEGLYLSGIGPHRF